MSIEAHAEAVAQLASDLEQLAKNARQLAAVIQADGWKPEELENGASLGITDAEGNELHVGDRVMVTGSDRYGEATATVRSVGPDRDDGKVRVCVALEDGQDDAYTPSTGRVTVIPADAEAVA